MIIDKGEITIDKFVEQNILLRIGDDMVNAWLEGDKDGTSDALDAINYIGDSGDDVEIMQYWAVSEWMGEKLKAKDEVVFNADNLILWGRQACGQCVSLDTVIEDIYNEMMSED